MELISPNGETVLQCTPAPESPLARFSHNDIGPRASGENAAGKQNSESEQNGGLAGGETAFVTTTSERHPEEGEDANARPGVELHP